MSQLTADMSPIRIDKGFALFMHIGIMATGQRRQKVIYQAVQLDNKKPIITIHLDEQDSLSLIVQNYKTPPIPASQFATFYNPKVKQSHKFVVLIAKVIPEESGITLDISVDDVHSKIKVTGDFSREYNAKQSIGADIHGGYPATFFVREIVFYDRALNEGELTRLKKYFEAK